MKQIFFVVLSLVSCVVTFAQASAHFGIKGGLNIATTTSSENGSADYKTGLNAGFLAHIHLTPQVALQPELVYSSQGNKYTISNGEHQLNLNYINIPLLLQYMFDNGFRLQTGPQLGFLVDVTDKKRNGAETGIFTSSDFKSTDVSWSFGLGYLGYSGLGVDARYNLGLSNINNDPAYSAKLRNSVFQVGMFYQFDHNHKRRSR